MESERPSVAVLLNPSAGGAGKPGIRADLDELFLAAGCEAEIVVLEKWQDATEAARSARTRASVVVAAGGDGTVSRVAAGLVGTPAALGVLPIGTLNHFAKDLRIPLDLDKAVATIASKHIRRVDVGMVNDRVFINNSSIGIYPSIVEAREQLRRQGHRKWPAMALATFRVLRRYRGVSVRIEVEGRQAVRRTPLVFVGNNAYALEGIHLGRRTRLDEGRLYAYLAPRVRARDLPLVVARAVLGRAARPGDFEIVAALELRVGTPKTRRIRVAFDGELATMTTPLHYRARPGALKVIVPAG